jgi:hypothetical protein
MKNGNLIDKDSIDDIKDEVAPNSLKSIENIIS